MIPLRARPTYTTPLALAHTTTKTHSKHATTDPKSERAVLRCLRARLAAYGIWRVLLFGGGVLSLVQWPVDGNLVT